MSSNPGSHFVVPLNLIILYPWDASWLIFFCYKKWSKYFVIDRRQRQRRRRRCHVQLQNTFNQKSSFPANYLFVLTLFHHVSVIFKVSARDAIFYCQKVRIILSENDERLTHDTPSTYCSYCSIVNFFNYFFTCLGMALPDG